MRKRSSCEQSAAASGARCRLNPETPHCTYHCMRTLGQFLERARVHQDPWPSNFRSGPRQSHHLSKLRRSVRTTASLAVAGATPPHHKLDRRRN